MARAGVVDTPPVMSNSLPLRATPCNSLKLWVTSSSINQLWNNSINSKQLWAILASVGNSSNSEQFLDNPTNLSNIEKLWATLNNLWSTTSNSYLLVATLRIHRATPSNTENLLQSYHKQLPSTFSNPSNSHQSPNNSEQILATRVQCTLYTSQQLPATLNNS